MEWNARIQAGHSVCGSGAATFKTPVTLLYINLSETSAPHTRQADPLWVYSLHSQMSTMHILAASPNDITFLVHCCAASRRPKSTTFSLIPTSWTRTYSLIYRTARRRRLHSHILEDFSSVPYMGKFHCCADFSKDQTRKTIQILN